jgi:hypothetical protein
MRALIRSGRNAIVAVDWDPAERRVLFLCQAPIARPIDRYDIRNPATASGCGADAVSRHPREPVRFLVFRVRAAHTRAEEAEPSQR